jgi:hypothetical protein
MKEGGIIDNQKESKVVHAILNVFLVIVCIGGIIGLFYGLFKFIPKELNNAAVVETYQIEQITLEINRDQSIFGTSISRKYVVLGRTDGDTIETIAVDVDFVTVYRKDDIQNPYVEVEYIDNYFINHMAVYLSDDYEIDSVIL